MYIDDMLCVGTKESLKAAIKDIGECFEINMEENLNDYLNIFLTRKYGRSKIIFGSFK